MQKNNFFLVSIFFIQFNVNATDILSCDYKETTSANGTWSNLKTAYHVDYYLNDIDNSAISIENNHKTQYAWYKVDSDSLPGIFLISKPVSYGESPFYTTTTISSAYSGYTISTTSSTTISVPMIKSYRGECKIVK
ncbi:hypothetical protein GNP63_19710 [Aliivibrio fischeri]|uniref:hypothetical protein n=1 Tax=Aliivibrio fischeri TaxID=668 RepID=UPI0012D91E0A|nr:hypothetical protein [Aliivibrio fischeri]MUH98733.1 hypothetical protein [Aliivibrio fischeri]MUI65930.1 hypothetical protein [Aliivibrio fischeri]